MKERIVFKYRLGTLPRLFNEVTLKENMDGGTIHVTEAKLPHFKLNKEENIEEFWIHISGNDIKRFNKLFLENINIDKEELIAFPNCRDGVCSFFEFYSSDGNQFTVKAYNLFMWNERVEGENAPKDVKDIIKLYNQLLLYFESCGLNRKYIPLYRSSEKDINYIDWNKFDIPDFIK